MQIPGGGGGERIAKTSCQRHAPFASFLRGKSCELQSSGECRKDHFLSVVQADPAIRSPPRGISDRRKMPPCC